MATKLVEETDMLSKQLQSSKVSAGEGVELCKFAPTTLQSMICDSYFVNVWEAADDLANQCDADETKLPPTKKLPKIYQVGLHEGDQYDTPKQYYSLIFSSLFNLLFHI